ncbi:MAG: class I SAM-dependent methyltransferase [Dehalococcoidia bacterium]|nr:class I SAM-dependent methyltransferase [Dehalococcoidia bacterium]
MKQDCESLPGRADILRMAKLKNKTLLDIGTGPLSIIAARDFNCWVTNIDISAEALRAAAMEVKREGLEHKISLEQEDAADLPYPDRAFHTVISYGALHHNSPNVRERIICEAYRVAEKQIIIAELTETGFNQIHSSSGFVAVDLDWLERILNSLGEVKQYSSKMMNVYTCKRETLLDYGCS